MKTIKLFLFFIPIIWLPIFTKGQVRVTGQKGDNPISVAVSFVSFAPDSRGSALGDAGVATSPDAQSIHWNNAKLAFIDFSSGFSFSYSPWLGNIVDDMSLNYLTYYKKIDQIQALGISMRYFDLGEIQLTDVTGLPIGIENPRELSFDATYSRKLTENLSGGLSIRYIWSNLLGNSIGAPSANSGKSLAFDLGFYYIKPLVLRGLDTDLSLGAHVSNLGQKISYTSEEFEDFIPANLRVGTALKMNIDQYNSFTFIFDINKLLVPTPPIYARDTNGDLVLDSNGNPTISSGKDPNRPFISGTFGSFNDAPNGFSEEMQELTYSIGGEYWYREMVAVRVGYFNEHENKGARKYFTVGFGVRYSTFGLDLSYLIPQEQNNPLGDTLRLSFLFNFNKKETLDVSS
jgi:hypothetical protein